MSYYSKPELRQKGEEIVEEAANATVREYQSQQEAERNISSDNNVSHGPGTSYTSDEVKEWVRGELDWIPDFFERQADPDPNGFDDIVSSVGTVQTKLGGGASADPNLDFTDKAQAEIEEWKGHLSENFQNSVTIPFPTIRDNQAAIATMLKDAIDGIQNLYRGWRRDNSALADETIKALKDCGTKDGGDAKLALSVVVALTSIASAALAVPTGGGSIVAGTAANAAIGSLMLSTVGAGAIIGGNFAPEGDPKLQLGAPTVNEVIANMGNAHTDFYNKLLDEEEKVTNVLNGNYDLITSLRQLANSEGVVSPIMPMRPKLADADNPSSGLAPE